MPAGARTALTEVAAEITAAVDIRLEHEAHYDWVAFVSQRDSNAGALTRYVGKVADSDEFKLRGIEARQRSTPPFVESVQRACLEVFDETRSPAAVVERLQAAIDRLHAGTVPPAALVITNRVSKGLDEYSQRTRNVAALERAQAQGLSVHPGQDVRYVVVDGTKASRERVVLAHEDPERYDVDYYEEELIGAVESLLAPVGWDRARIREAVAETTTPTLSAYNEGE